MENVDTIKAVVKRMCDELGAKGIQVKHTLMLEALASGFGLDSWRELKAVIDAPRARPAKTTGEKGTAEPTDGLPPLGEWQQWTVHAIYEDNDQQYGNDFQGRTPLEGAVNALMDRLTDFGNVIHVHNVLDASGRCRLSPNYVTNIELYGNVIALRALAREVMAVPRVQMSAEQVLACDWLYSVLKGDIGQPRPNGSCAHEAPEDSFAHLTDWSAVESSVMSPREQTPEGILVGSELLPTQALDLLCDLAESRHGGVVALESRDEVLATLLYQVRAMCSYFGDVVDSSEYGLAGFQAPLPKAPQLI